MLLTTLLLASSLTTPSNDQLNWFSGPFMNAIGVSQKKERPILLYFWSDGSGQCKKLYQETLCTPEAAKALDDFVLVSANTGDKAGYALVERFGIKTLPTLLVLDAEGKPNDAILGYIGAEGLADEVARIERNEGTVSALRSAVAEEPKNLEHRMTLAIKLSDVGDAQGFETERTALYELDPKHKQLPTSKMRLWQLQEDAGGSEEAIKQADLAPMKKFLAKNEHSEILFAGWNWVAEIASYQEKLPEARVAAMTLWEHVPEEKVAQIGNTIATNFYEQREELSKKERKFALQAAKASVAAVETWSTGESCGEGCYCEGCTEGCVGEKGEMLVKRELYVARAYDTLACAYAMNGKRRDALAAVDKSLEIDPENESFVARRAELKKRS